MHGGDIPQVGKRPIQSPNATKAKQELDYINKDNRQIYTPIYPISRIQDNQPRTCDIDNV